MYPTLSYLAISNLVFWVGIYYARLSRNVCLFNFLGISGFILFCILLAPTGNIYGLVTYSVLIYLITIQRFKSYEYQLGTSSLFLKSIFLSLLLIGAIIGLILVTMTLWVRKGFPDI